MNLLKHYSIIFLAGFMRCKDETRSTHYDGV
ncbi:unnamed protein product, partial [Allacma fusca]